MCELKEAQSCEDARNARKKVLSPPEKEEEVNSQDSISVASQASSKGTQDSTASAHLLAKAEKAAVITKAAALNERHTLEEKEDHLAKEREELVIRITST